jgi:hypothetical protein
MQLEQNDTLIYECAKWQVISFSLGTGFCSVPQTRQYACPGPFNNMYKQLLETLGMRKAAVVEANAEVQATAEVKEDVKEGSVDIDH